MLASNTLPTVSVVIASYNMGKYVCEAVDSVLDQPMQDLEVIVVDDGSKDDTLEVLKKYEHDPRVRVIATPNQGQPKAKNTGVRASRGRFIAFCDADDYWLPNKLPLQLPRFHSNPKVGVVYSPITQLHADGSLHAQPGREFFRGDVLARMFVRNIVPFGTAVIRRECLEQVGDFDESIPMGIDWELWLRIAPHWQFDYVEESTYIYRIWDGQMSKNWRGRYDNALKIMTKFLDAHPDRLSRHVVAIGYADTYTNLATEYLRHSMIGDCFQQLGQALRWRVTYWQAWRLLLGMPYYWFRDHV